MCIFFFIVWMDNILRCVLIQEPTTEVISSGSIFTSIHYKAVAIKVINS